MLQAAGTKPEEECRTEQGAKCRLQAFIATLITMTAYRGLAYIITDGKPISRLAESAASGSFFFKALGKGNVLLFETIKLPIPEVLKMSAKASSIAVTREGAVPSIPYRAEVLEALQA